MRQSESDEFGAVLSDHGESVWRLIVRILGNDSHDAADCFQQAFVEFASRFRQSNNVHHPGALLKRIASARSVDAVRRRIRERLRSQDANANLIASRREFEPDERAEIREFLDNLRSALTELPELQSTAFVLTQIENMRNDEAAAAIGVTVNHLGVLLHRACVALQRRLESYKPVRESRT